MGATHAEKSTVKAGHLNAVATGGAGGLEAAAEAARASYAAAAAEPASDIRFCAVDDPSCEACQ